jgi:hypothetical protein
LQQEALQRSAWRRGVLYLPILLLLTRRQHCRKETLPEALLLRSAWRRGMLYLCLYLGERGGGRGGWGVTLRSKAAGREVWKTDLLVRFTVSKMSDPWVCNDTREREKNIYLLHSIGRGTSGGSIEGVLGRVPSACHCHRRCFLCPAARPRGSQQRRCSRGKKKFVLHQILSVLV